LLTVQAWVPLLIVTLIVYGIYRLVRWIVVSTSPPAEAKNAAATAVPPELAKTVAAPSSDAARMPDARRSLRDRNRWRRKEQPLAALVLGTPRERARDLLGSLLLSALVAAVLTIVMVFVVGFNNELRLEEMAWLFSISVAGSWAVLIPSKFWEGTKGDASLRRFLMMVFGMGLGVLACVSANYFHANILHRAQDAIFENPVPAHFYGMDGQPMLPAFVIVFTLLFLVIRWWRQADPLRSSRFSILSLLVTLAIAFVVSGIWHFPQPWLTMIAAAISISVQLSSPWVHPRERTAIRR
jgi:eukaryotic-like serine/threonine-protein kinase